MISLDSLFQCLTAPSVEKFLLTAASLLPQSEAIDLGPYTCHLRESQHLIAATPSWLLQGMMKSPLSLIFSRLNHPRPSAVLYITRFLVSSPASVLSSVHTWATQCPACNEGPQTEHSIWGLTSSVLHEKDQFPNPDHYSSSDVVQNSTSLLGHLRIQGSPFEAVVNNSDHYSPLKHPKSNACCHFKMLSLGFRGNAPEWFTLCKVMIFTAQRLWARPAEVPQAFDFLAFQVDFVARGMREGCPWHSAQLLHGTAAQTEGWSCTVMWGLCWTSTVCEQ